VAELAHGVREVLQEYLVASGHELVRHECGLSAQRLKAVIWRPFNIGNSDILPGASSPQSKESASLASAARPCRCGQRRWNLPRLDILEA